MAGDSRNLSRRASKRGKGRELRNTREGITEQVLPGQPGTQLGAPGRQYLRCPRNEGSGRVSRTPRRHPLRAARCRGWTPRHPGLPQAPAQGKSPQDTAQIGMGISHEMWAGTDDTCYITLLHLSSPFSFSPLFFPPFTLRSLLGLMFLTFFPRVPGI